MLRLPVAGRRKLVVAIAVVVLPRLLGPCCCRLVVVSGDRAVTGTVPVVVGTTLVPGAEVPGKVTNGQGTMAALVKVYCSQNGSGPSK